jgi:hypothetical protein
MEYGGGMIVSELVNKLQELPQDALVILDDSENLAFRVLGAYVVKSKMYLTAPCVNAIRHQEVVIISPCNIDMYTEEV